MQLLSMLHDAICGEGEEDGGRLSFTPGKRGKGGGTLWETVPPPSCTYSTSLVLYNLGNERKRHFQGSSLPG